MLSGLALYVLNRVFICHEDIANAARNNNVQNIFLIVCFEAMMRGGPWPDVYSQ